MDERRHLDGIKGSFYISEGEYLVPAIFHEEAKVASKMIYSNVREQVEHRQYVFDTLWNKSIPSEEKIKAIEHGIQPHVTEVIRDGQQMQMLAYELGTSARDEILLLYSTANALNRQSKLGALQALEAEVATKSRLKIRVLTPFDDSIKQLAQELGKFADVRYIPEELQTQLSIVYSIENRHLLSKSKMTARIPLMKRWD